MSDTQGIDPGSDTSTAAQDEASPIIFINHTHTTLSGGKPRKVGGTVKQWQARKKQRDQRVSANREATYARSLVGWAPRHPSPLRDPERTDDDEESDWLVAISRARITPPISGGIRNDPFGAFPCDRSKDVMAMVDYHIHVWSPHKSGRFDIYLGMDTQVDVCWPLALQNTMLFDATIAVSRIAWCFSHGVAPQTDELMLCHRAMAMSKLRDCASSPRLLSREETIFSIIRMVAISYMTYDSQAFSAHFEALDQLVPAYIASKSPADAVSQTIDNRYHSWKALSDYRKGLDPLMAYLPSDSIFPATPMLYWPSGTARAGQGFAWELPPAFHELLANSTLSFDILYLAQPIMVFVTQNSADPGPGDVDLETTCNRLARIMRTTSIPPLELQFCHAILACCIRYRNSQQMGSPNAGMDVVPTASVGVFELETVAQAFLHSKFADSHLSNAHKLMVLWCGLIIASTCITCYELGCTPGSSLLGKGHVILVSLADRILKNRLQSTWTSIELSLRDQFPWSEMLASEIKQSWETSMKRQKAWEDRGLLKFCAPRKFKDDGTEEEPDVVEYLVLNECRGALPDFNLR